MTLSMDYPEFCVCEDRVILAEVCALCGKDVHDSDMSKHKLEVMLAALDKIKDADYTITTGSIGPLFDMGWASAVKMFKKMIEDALQEYRK